MGSLINTRLLDFRATSDVDKWETRPNSWGFLDFFQRETENPNGIITPDLKTKAVQAVGSGLQIPVIDYDASVQVYNQTFPLAISGSPSTSQLYDITFTHYYFGIQLWPAQHYNNHISMQREFNILLKKHIYKMADMMEAASGAALEAGKTQVLADTLGGRYSKVSNVIVGPLAEQDAIIGDINPIMRGNQYSGPFHVITNPAGESHVRNRLLEKGEFNTENKTYQYNDKTWHFTNQLPNAAGHKATFMVVQEGSVGLLQQFSPDCVLGHRTEKHLWDIEILPILNIPIGVYQYVDAVDGSSVGGAATAHLTATLAQSFGFHHAVAYLTPHTSAPSTNAAAIAKMAIATS